MKDTITTQVKLKSFNGEGLWVTPVSYMPNDYWEKPKDRNKLKLYTSPEGHYPYIDFYLQVPSEDKLSHFPNLYKLRLCEAVKAITLQLIFNSRHFFGEAVFDKSFTRRSWWDLVYYSIQRSLEKDWFYCREVYPINLHIEGNIELVDENNYWEEGYLTPTSKWIEERLSEEEVYIFDEGKNKVKESLENLYNLENFYKWKKEQEDKGLSISYITSLET